MKKRQMTGILFVLPSLIGVCIFVLIPFLDVIRRSLLEAVNSRWVGIQNYLTVFTNPAFLLAGKNTLRFVGICIPLLIVLSLSIAAFLNRQAAGGILKTCFLLPMAIPVASVVLLWRVLFLISGLLNHLLLRLGYAGTDWMNTGFAFWILVISYLWRNLGYNIVLWMAGLSSIPVSLYEAARVDGAGSFQCFLKITMPGLMPTLFTISVLSLLNSFKVFREGYLVAGDYPHESMYLLQHLFNNWFRDLSLDKMAAGAVTCAAVIFALVLILKKSWGGEED